MQSSPFAIFRQFPELSVWILRKEDDVSDDASTAKALGDAALATVEQTHGKRTVIVRTHSERDEPADGMLTDAQGLAVAVRWGDCQNFVAYAPGKRVAGVLHAGWRGLAAGAIPEFFRVLQAEWGIRGEETYVGAGPSLCMRCADFTDPANELPAQWAPWTDGRNVDLRAVADAQLRMLGVSGERLERHPDCTRCMPETYWTWRGGHKEAMNKGLRNLLACRLEPR